MTRLALITFQYSFIVRSFIISIRLLQSFRDFFKNSCHNLITKKAHFPVGLLEKSAREKGLDGVGGGCGSGWGKIEETKYFILRQ